MKVSKCFIGMLASYIAKEEGKIALYYIIYKTPKNINLFKNSNKVSISNFSKIFYWYDSFAYYIYICFYFIHISCNFTSSKCFIDIIGLHIAKKKYIYNRGRNIELYYIIVWVKNW